MRRSLIVVALAFVTLALSPAPRTQTMTTTVLVTMQAGVDLWMPVSRMIPTDAQGRLWWGSVPVQTHRLFWMEDDGINAAGSHLVVAADATAASTSLYADVRTVGHDNGIISANGWLTGPGQMIFYQRREPVPANPGGDMRVGKQMRFTQLRPSGIGSIFGTLYAGTVISEASQYLIAYGIPDEERPYLYSGRTHFKLDIPAGTVLTSSPQ